MGVGLKGVEPAKRGLVVQLLVELLLPDLCQNFLSIQFVLQICITKESSSHLLTVLHIKDLNEVGFPGIVLCQGCRSRYSFLPTPSSLCNSVIASHLSALDVFLL